MERLAGIIDLPIYSLFLRVPARLLVVRYGCQVLSLAKNVGIVKSFFHKHAPNINDQVILTISVPPDPPAQRQNLFSV